MTKAAREGTQKKTSIPAVRKYNWEPPEKPRRMQFKECFLKVYYDFVA